MSAFLTESCLLTQGLSYITDETLETVWPDCPADIAWVEAGRVVTGNLNKYLSFRYQKPSLRVNILTLDKALEEGLTGALTASGTMAVCEKEGIPLAVSCGISGLKSPDDAKPSLDLYALQKLKVSLLCTSFKDMYDFHATIKWLAARNIKAAGYASGRLTGYVFNSADIALPRALSDIGGLSDCRLILNPIPAENKIQDISLLTTAIEAGNRAAAEGRAFHPAVNAALDTATDGLSSKLQLDALIENIKLAARLTLP